MLISFSSSSTGYHSHSTTGRSPAELLLGRKLRSHLDFIFPEGRIITYMYTQDNCMHTLNHREVPKLIPGKVTAVSPAGVY